MNSFYGSSSNNSTYYIGKINKKMYSVFMIDNNIVSPCISVCKTDPISGFCYGCGRSNEDKAGWKNPGTPIKWKIANLATIRKRLNGWQKEAFDQSYAFKKETGMSLIKKKLLEQKK